MAISSGVTASDPSLIVASSLPVASAPKKTSAAEDRRRPDREAHLVVGPGDRVDDRDDDREQRQRDHDQQEGQVAEARDRRRASPAAR